MYQKIEMPEDTHLFRTGALIIQYPVSGEPKDVIDLSDPTSFALFELQMLKGSEVYLQQTDVKDEKIITKSIEELLNENNWWIRPSS